MSLNRIPFHKNMCWYRQISNIRRTKSQIYWSHVLSWEWRCSWSSADRRCSNYFWVINNLIAHKGATYIRDLTVFGNNHHENGLVCLHSIIHFTLFKMEHFLHGETSVCLSTTYMYKNILRVKNSRGAPLGVQNRNKMIDLDNFGGQKDRLHAENGGLRNETQQDLNKMVDKVKFWGAKRSSRCRKWRAKLRRIPTDSQRGSAPRPPTPGSE